MSNGGNQNWRRFAVLICLAITLLYLVGCGQKDPGTSTGPAGTKQAAGSGGHASDAFDKELVKFLNDPFEADPEKRKTVISERMPTQFDWGLQTLQKGYHKTGRTSPKWDALVTNAFTAYTKFRIGDHDAYDGVANAVKNAIRAGCDDPMIRYMHSRYRLGDEPEDSRALAVARLQAHEAVLRSDYHPLYKFLAGQRASMATRGASTNVDQGARLHLTTMSLEDLARDTNAPVDDVFTSATSWAHYSVSKGWINKSTEHLRPLLQKYWGDQERYYRWCGLLEERLAWEERGGGFVDTVTEQGWQGFSEHLQTAETYLVKAWQMNTNSYETAFLMMRLELGQGKGRSVMQERFNRAMALSPNSYEAASLMGFYLEPRWHGTSDQESLEFARSCVSSTNWFGNVPLVLADLHHSLAKFLKLQESPKYWHRPQVWLDVQSSYEKFFKFSPGAYSWRHNYAKDAFLCGRYEDFLTQAGLFSGHTNFAWFGGREKWDAMLAEAVQHQKQR